MITVNEVMNTDLITISEDTTISDAKMIMTDKNIRHIPVIKDENILIGLITQRDILKAESAKLDRNELGEIVSPVSEMMASNLSFVYPEDSLRTAGKAIQKHKFGCMPVVEGKQLVGILTDSDFVDVAIDLIEQMDIQEDEYAEDF